MYQEVVSLKSIFKDVKDKHNVKHKTHFLLIHELPEKTQWKLLFRKSNKVANKNSFILQNL